THDRSVFAHEFFDGPHIDALAVVDAAAYIAERDDLHAVLRQRQRRHRADIAEPLNHGGAFVRLQAKHVHRAIDQVGDPTPGRLASSDRTTQADGLPGHNA